LEPKTLNAIVTERKYVEAIAQAGELNSQLTRRVLDKETSIRLIDNEIRYQSINQFILNLSFMELKGWTKKMDKSVLTSKNLNNPKNTSVMKKRLKEQIEEKGLKKYLVQYDPSSSLLKGTLTVMGCRKELSDKDEMIREILRLSQKNALEYILFSLPVKLLLQMVADSHLNIKSSSKPVIVRQLVDMKDYVPKEKKVNPNRIQYVPRTPKAKPKQTGEDKENRAPKRKPRIQDIELFFTDDSSSASEFDPKSVTEHDQSVESQDDADKHPEPKPEDVFTTDDEDEQSSDDYVESDKEERKKRKEEKKNKKQKKRRNRDKEDDKKHRKKRRGDSGSDKKGDPEEVDKDSEKNNEPEADKKQAEDSDNKSEQEQHRDNEDPEADKKQAEDSEEDKKRRKKRNRSGEDSSSEKNEDQSKQKRRDSEDKKSRKKRHSKDDATEKKKNPENDKVKLNQIAPVTDSTDKGIGRKKSSLIELEVDPKKNPAVTEGKSNGKKNPPPIDIKNDSLLQKEPEVDPKKKPKNSVATESDGKRNSQDMQLESEMELKKKLKNSVAAKSDGKKNPSDVQLEPEKEQNRKPKNPPPTDSKNDVQDENESDTEKERKKNKKQKREREKRRKEPKKKSSSESS
jgi:hypothetical protein